MRDPRVALAATLSRIDGLLSDLGQTRGDVLDIDQLHRETGVAPDVIDRLLRGEEVAEEPFGDRVRYRIQHLRDTRRRPDGARPSYQEIAKSFGLSGAAISAIIKSSAQSGPLAATQAGIETYFFGRPNGFLSVEAVPALDAALQPILQRLQREAQLAAGRRSEPEAAWLSDYDDVRGVALRQAHALPEKQWRVLNAALTALLEQENESEGER